VRIDAPIRHTLIAQAQHRIYGYAATLAASTVKCNASVWCLSVRLSVPSVTPKTDHACASNHVSQTRLYSNPVTRRQHQTRPANARFGSSVHGPNALVRVVFNTDAFVLSVVHVDALKFTMHYCIRWQISHYPRQQYSRCIDRVIGGICDFECLYVSAL